jgi:hypothetical protein
VIGERASAVLMPQYIDNLVAIHGFDFAGADLSTYAAPKRGSYQAALWQLNFWQRVLDDARTAAASLVQGATDGPNCLSAGKALAALLDGAEANELHADYLALAGGIAALEEPNQCPIYPRPLARCGVSFCPKESPPSRSFVTRPPNQHSPRHTGANVYFRSRHNQKNMRL